jgi:predicted peroxiredoxin
LEKLGILINSTAYAQSIIQLSKAAKERGKAVEIFLAAEGVRFLAGDTFNKIAGIDQVWICAKSFETLKSDLELLVPEKGQLVSAEQLADFLRSCDRHVVF